jgi:hypothetical protein
MADRIETHREMARRMYESQVDGYKVGHIERHGGWTADGKVHEPYELTLFSPKRGDWTVTVTPEKPDPNPEFQMYWTGMPDFGIRNYEVFPHEDGWVCRMVYKGTTRDGTEVVAHQVDFATVDEQGRVVRMEWYTDPNQWLRVWSAASGKSIEEVSALFDTLNGFQRLIDETIAGRDARAAADQARS